MPIRLTPAQLAAMGVDAQPTKKARGKKAPPAINWAAWGLPEPLPEFRFCERRWRFDFAWPQQKVALEIEGGVWTGGRHTRSKGFLGDVAKYNRAAVLGWCVIRATPAQVRSGEIFPVIREALGLQTTSGPA